MRLLIGFFFIVMAAFTYGQKKSISILLEETRAYCGGASPGEDILQEINKKRPFANKMVYIYSRSRCIDSVRTDSAGVLKLKLKRGKYELFLPWKHFKSVPVGSMNEYDQLCLKKEWKRFDATLEVRSTGHTFINPRLTHQFCKWQYNCLKERHIPPSAQKQN